MRRSHAPSVLRAKAQQAVNGNNGTTNRERSESPALQDAEGSQTIERLPLFGFLEVPNNLRRQYVVPGCKITKKSIELRKIKVLGAGYHKTPFLKPGGMISFKPVGGLLENGAQEEDSGGEDLPTGSSIPPHEPLILWRDDGWVPPPPSPDTMDVDETSVATTTITKSHPKQHVVQVIPELASKLRPHQREGVQFLFECTMGLRGYEGEGCILADDMGLGKTLMSITLLWTLLNQGIDPKNPSKSAVSRAIVACPTSLVGNWDNEIKKWISGDRCVTFPVRSEAKKSIKN